MRNGVLFLFVILLTIIPLIFIKNAEFGGADGQAGKVITEVEPDYEPWFNAIWEPPSGEIESLLFSLQAALGAIIIGYVIGYGKARKKYSSAKE
ncbi:energy-coupling factor ABC transporter substrate-binding protein [Neobacillus sp. 179-C4.2 HS]|uniref:Cobalt transport protein CbiN n=1 Tax=Neobacillus driksii TaxID=3035913 RepID=A0ABV4YRP5_9BACI|nr:energy-coupling factor ABC transporter substrate-binding protein [Neobacillus sp. 179.-C4.2 HS]MDP5195107.1 energy-coupling factor ABC transporter substrate-binding protein [Neobacillus sp. 179.-C4.2 HS]